MTLRARIQKSIEQARTRLRVEVRAVEEALQGGPQYDENGDTIYPPDAVILHDAARDERNRQR